MALRILDLGGRVRRVRGNSIFEFLGETGLPVEGISEDALIQYYFVVERLRVNSPRISAERDKPMKTRTTDSLRLNAQSWMRIVTEVLGQTPLFVETIPEDVLIQILEVVYEMRIRPENPDPIAKVLNQSQPKSLPPEPQPKPPEVPQPESDQPTETDGHSPLPDLADQPGLGASTDDHEDDSLGMSSC